MQLLLPLLLLLPTLLDRPTADRPCAKNIHHHAIEGSVKDFFYLKGVLVLRGKNPQICILWLPYQRNTKKNEHCPVKILKNSLTIISTHIWILQYTRTSTYPYDRAKKIRHLSKKPKHRPPMLLKVIIIRIRIRILFSLTSLSKCLDSLCRWCHKYGCTALTGFL